jgi:hypothetical protein
MNSSQRNVVFGLLIVAAPLVFFYVAEQIRGAEAPFAGALAALACIGGAFFIRAGRGKK